MACVHNLCANQACRSATIPFKDEAQCDRWLILLGRSGNKDWFINKTGKPKLKEGAVLVDARAPSFKTVIFIICVIDFI